MPELGRLDRKQVAALAGLGQGDGDGLLDRLFLGRRVAGADRSILLPVIHQRLDIAADDRLAGSFFERHDVHPCCGILGARFPTGAATVRAMRG